MKKLLFTLLLLTHFWCNLDTGLNTGEQVIPNDTVMTNSARSGIITLSNNDTVRFDNGVSLRTEMDSSTGVKGYSYKCWSLVVDDTTNVLSFGLKYSIYQRWCESGIMTESKSQDTIWKNARTFPDTLYPLSNYKIRYYLQSTDVIFQQTYYKIEYYNNILYFNTKKNKMMLQIIECNQKNLKLSWAVDSLGTGTFNSSVQLFKRTGNSELLANY